MANGRRASMSTIQDAIKSVEKQVRAYGDNDCDPAARDAAVKFLEGLDAMVGAFCRRLTGDSEVLDPCPPRKR